MGGLLLIACTHYTHEINPKQPINPPLNPPFSIGHHPCLGLAFVCKSFVFIVLRHVFAKEKPAEAGLKVGAPRFELGISSLSGNSKDR